jgi:hypothetical protein
VTLKFDELIYPFFNKKIMAFINVKLRIVGLYFNKMVRINDVPNLTVRDVLDEYIRLNPNLAVPDGLEYSRYPVGPTDSVKTFTHHFSGSYDFNGNNVITTPPDGPTLGNNSRPAGIYTLSEDLEDQFSDTKVGLVWQYYVVSPTGIVKSRTPSSRGFQLFGITPPSYNLGDGDTIFWRLVAIARAPNFPL